ncbi:hypothetical protein [Caballeronia sp. J97]|uniref:hypothetical protein n=1 Tax=Caballeronia sp. J97 TaxID=2805429 RepID=UPI002AAFC869|nr:hypothetical protein [Caballeronia sp. J97]
MSDFLAGALCVLAALSAGSSMRVGIARSRGMWEAGALLVAACCAGGAQGVVGLVLAAVAGCVGYRSGRGGSGASTQALLATLAFVAWMLPGSGSAYAVLAGGAIAALGLVLGLGTSRESIGVQPMHLACAGACAALAYAFGAQSGALAVLPVIAMIALIGAHLSLAMGGNAAAPAASVMSAAAAGGLALAAALGGAQSALAVAAVAIAIGCARSAALAGIVRETR